MVAPAYPFVALHDLALNGIRAFAKGDGIPADNAGFDEWVEGEDYAAADTEEAEEAITGPQRPAGNASKEAWQEYAAALAADGDPLGLTLEESADLGRDDIIAHLDGQRG